MMQFKRKGMAIPENTTELLIGLLTLLLVGGMIIMLYKIFIPDESTNAKKTIDVIEAKINYLNENQKGTFPIQGFKGAVKESWISNGWFLAGWSKQETLSEHGKPDKCFFDSCICICKGTLSGGRKSLGEKCQEEGFCRKLDVNNVSVMRNVLINDPSSGVVHPEDGSIIYTRQMKSDCTGIGLRANLIEISMEKKKDEIKLLYSSEEYDGNCFVN